MVLKRTVWTICGGVGENYPCYGKRILQKTSSLRSNLNYWNREIPKQVTSYQTQRIHIKVKWFSLVFVHVKDGAQMSNRLKENLWLQKLKQAKKFILFTVVEKYFSKKNDWLQEETYISISFLPPQKSLKEQSLPSLISLLSVPKLCCHGPRGFWFLRWARRNSCYSFLR